MPILRDFYNVGENCELMFHIHHTPFSTFFKGPKEGVFRDGKSCCKKSSYEN